MLCVIRTHFKASLSNFFIYQKDQYTKRINETIVVGTRIAHLWLWQQEFPDDIAVLLACN